MADELLGVLSLERSLGATKALLVAGLVDLHDTVASNPAPGAERLVRSGHEGTPLVAEFLYAELAPLLGVTIPAASALVSDVMDLRHRLPRTWAALLAGRVELWQGLQVAQAKGMRDLDRAAAARAERARGEQFVRVTHDGDGMSTLVARLRTAGAVLLEAAVDGYVRQEVAAGSTEQVDVLRAEGLVRLATPTAASDAAGTLRRPEATVVVHLSPDSEVVRTEGDLGPVLKAHLAELLQHHRIRVLPVVDLADHPQVDAYEVPVGIGRHVRARDPFEMFPFSVRGSRGLDLDHSDPWRDDGTRGQTRAANLAPLGRFAHRAKTHGDFELTQTAPGILAWVTRLGYEWLVDRQGTHPRGDVPNAGGADVSFG